MSEERIAVVRRALEAAATGDAESVQEDFTDDVHGSAPGGHIKSRAELLDVLSGRDDAFSDVSVSLEGHATSGDGDAVFAEWIVHGTHTGPLDFEGMRVEPTGRRIELHGASVAVFRGDQIAHFHQYWNELDLIEQLGLLDDSDD